MIPSKVLAGITPDCRQTDLPSLNRIRVGTERIWNLSAKVRFLSTSILMILAESPILDFSCSKIGFNCLHGPHHSAEKSTKTGSGDFNSSANLLIICKYLVVSNQSPRDLVTTLSFSHCFAIWSLNFAI